MIFHGHFRYNLFDFVDDKKAGVEFDIENWWITHGKSVILRLWLRSVFVGKVRHEL